MSLKSTPSIWTGVEWTYNFTVTDLVSLTGVLIINQTNVELVAQNAFERIGKGASPPFVAPIKLPKYVIEIEFAFSGRESIYSQRPRGRNFEPQHL